MPKQKRLPGPRRGFIPEFRHVIGRRIRFLIGHRNSNREAVADECSITPEAVYHWEKGQDNPSYENFLNLALMFDVPLDYLCCIEFHGLTPAQLVALPDRLVARPPLSGTEESERQYAPRAA